MARLRTRVTYVEMREDELEAQRKHRKSRPSRGNSDTMQLID